MKGKTNIILTGVGGQGIITAAKILGKAAVNADVNVFVSEVHGMAQRGGSVICTVRMGNVSGPLLASGTADIILSMEPIEALRYIKYSNLETKIITDVTPVIPFTVSVGMEEYPDIEDVFKELEAYSKLYKIDALKLAEEAGNAITKNIVMLGALSATNLLPLKTDVLLKTILQTVPDEYEKVNKEAFERGVKAFRKI